MSTLPALRGYRAPRRVRSSLRTLPATPFIVFAFAGLATYLVQDWIAGLGIVVLWAIWKLLFEDGEPPVLAVALTFQWLQVTCGLYYFGLTGRQVQAMYASDYRPMVLIGLGCVATLLAGLVVGLKVGDSAFESKPTSIHFAFSWRLLFMGYIFSIFLNAALYELAWTIPVLTQGILAVGYLRLGLLFLIFRRLIRPKMRWNWFAAILGAELLLGFAGFFAGFREPLVLATVAFVECFDRRIPSHWIRLGGIAVLMAALGAVWTGIRTTYRQEFSREGFSESTTERLQTAGELSSQWVQGDSDSMAGDFDRFIERIWAIYYPAIAISRVPEVLPHEGGAIMWSAVKHIVTPRILFPEKDVLPSDSELVRKYTGIPVAGADENTSIAFGYAAESYVDFGLPWMFIPSLIFGLMMGMLYRYLFRLMHHRELAVALVSVVFWLSLYLFERSWIKTLGLSFTLAIYLGLVFWILDRHLRQYSLRGAMPRRSLPRRSSR